MGKVFDSESILRGEVPDAKGMSQLRALREIKRRLEEVNATSSSFGVVFQGYGSSTTGKAGRRGDVDMAIGYGRSPDRLERIAAGETEQFERAFTQETVVEQELFMRAVRLMVAAVCQREHVRPEAHFFSLLDAREGMATIRDDSLYLSHVCSSPPEWRIGDIPYYLGAYAIDIEQPLLEDQCNQIAATGLLYMALKARYFLGAMQHIGQGNDNEALQRAIEFAKAAARKTMAVSAIEGRVVSGADVTSKPSMYAEFQSLTDGVENGSAMLSDHAELVMLDREYDEVLEVAIANNKVGEYDRWIKQRLCHALKTAYRLAANCYRYVDEVGYREGIVIADFYDDAYRLVKEGDFVDAPGESSSAPLLDDHQLLSERQTVGL